MLKQLFFRCQSCRRQIRITLAIIDGIKHWCKIQTISNIAIKTYILIAKPIIDILCNLAGFKQIVDIITRTGRSLKHPMLCKCSLRSAIIIHRSYAVPHTNINTQIDQRTVGCIRYRPVSSGFRIAHLDSYSHIVILPVTGSPCTILLRHG